MSLRRPMVERLRMTAAAMDGAASSTPQQLTGGAARGEVATAARATAAHPIGWQPAWALAWAARTPRGPACAPVAVWSAGDALFRAHAAPLQESHEQHTIKQLLRLVQELTAERDEAREKLRAARQASGSEAARQEIESLQKQNVALAQENANMYAVIDQNRALTALLEELRPGAAQQRVEGAESLPRGHAESARGT